MSIYIKNNPRKTDNEKLFLVIGLSLMKILYMVAVDLMLPENWLLWPYHKSINWAYIFVELIPFYITMIVYCSGQRKKSILGFFSTMFFILYFIPNNSGLSLSNYDFTYYSLVNLFCLLVFFVIHCFEKNEKDCDVVFDMHAIWTNRKLIRTIRIITLIVCVIEIIYTYFYNGLNIAAVFSSEIYDVRGDYAAYAAGIEDTFISYVVLLVTSSISWFLAIGLYNAVMDKKTADIFLCLFAYLASFSMQMQKSTIASVLLVLFVAFVESQNKLNKINKISVWGVNALFVVVILEFLIFRKSSLFRLIVSRVFYMPAYLTEKYYAFFSQNSKLWLSQDVFFIQNIVRALFGSPYNCGAVKIISKEVFNGLIPSPNNGLFSEAFSQMGYVGVAVFPIIYGLIIKTMRDCSAEYGPGVATVIMIKLTLVLISVPSLRSGNIIGIMIFAFTTYFFVRPAKRPPFPINSRKQMI